MSTIENINVGDYLVVISENYRPEKFIPNGFEFEHVTEIRRVTPEPLKVVAIATPFVLCEQLGKVKGPNLHRGPVTIDCRHTRWTKVDELFVREFCRLEGSDIPDDVKTEEDKEEDQKRLCPLCLEQMIERRNMSDKNGWVLACNQCKMQYVSMS